MRARILALAVLLAPSAARAEHTPQTLDPPPYVYPWAVRMLSGIGWVPNVSTPYFVTTIEGGRHPFGGAFYAGGALLLGGDPAAGWLMAGLGLQMKLDLTYVFLSAFWTQKFNQCFPFHIELGGRLAAVWSTALGVTPAYDLLRVEMQSSADLVIPFGARRAHGLVVRGAIDTPVSLNTLLRWSVSLGWAFDLGRE